MAESEEQKAPEMFSIERSEFDRLQMQLIELRTTNYQLKEQHSKSSAEVAQLQQTVHSQARDLEKANKTIQRSKKAKEFSTLVEENDSIQRKLERQEEDFRLQNRTLMEELSKVCEEKESVEAELKQLQKGGGGAGGGAMDQVTHLKAENTALLKSVQALKERLQEQSGAPSTSEGADGPEDSRPSLENSEQVSELQLRLSTEEEEKKLLQERLAMLQEETSKQQAELKSELEKWTEKAKKKQDSLVQLQEEKERLFHENRAAFDEMVRSKDHEIQTLQGSLQQAQRNLQAKNQATEATQEVAKQLESLKRSEEELSLKVSTLVQEREILIKGKEESSQLLTELGRELQQAKAQLGEEKKKVHDLTTQLEEAKMSQEQLADQVVSTSEEKHKILVDLEAANKLAEKRKSLLDEMAIRGQESATEQQRKVGEIEEKYKDELSRLEELLQQEQARNWKLTEVAEEVPTLRSRCKEASERAESLEGRVQQLEQTLEREREENKEAVKTMETQQQEEKTALEEKLASKEEVLSQQEERVKELEGVVEDKQEAVRIVEKKSQSLLKDLKRQLQQMQKREERLQEQLSEIRGSQMLELQREVSQDYNSTHSRESSLSSMRGVLKAAETPDTPGGLSTLPSLASGGAVSEETQELLARVAELQQDKWTLEEKVHHLENTGSALAEDVIQKSEIIKTYFMETKADHQPSQSKSTSIADKLSPMKLMSRVRSKEETLEEINRKMQRALEEALMKNIHLQQNMEMLSAALEEAKAGSSPQSSAEQPATTSESEPVAAKLS